MRSITFSALFLFCALLHAQVNLVVNPSFELYSTCPTGPGDIYKAFGWDTYNGSPDYFNSCGSTGVQVPTNSFGYQQAAMGSAYAGIITYYSGGMAREIIGDSLSEPLVPSQKYYLTFKVSRADDATVVGYSCNNIGAQFSTVKSFPVSIDNSAVINNSSIITDTTNWIRISGSFVADSAYKYLLIGNFFDDANTTVTNQSSGIYAYYFIDEVCLSTDSLYCANFSTSIDEVSHKTETVLFPNPANDQVIIKSKETSRISVYNSQGQNVFSEIMENTECILNTAEWTDGVYLVYINTKSYKLIIHH